MKNCLLLFCTLFFYFSQAQEVILTKETKIDSIVKGTYYKTDPELLKAFIGIWTTDLDNKKFFFEIFEDKSEINEIFINVLHAKHYFDNDNIYLDKKINFSRASTPIDSIRNGELEFLFIDYEKEKHGKLFFKVLKNGKATFSLKESPHLFFKINGKISPFEKGFSIPQEMVLTKIK